jgi:hypothetical protein
MNKRLAAAMGAYAVLVAIAFRVLQGKVLYIVVALLGALAIKTLAADRTMR